MLIQRKSGEVNVELLEQSPASENRRAVVQEDLAQARGLSAVSSGAP